MDHNSIGGGGVATGAPGLFLLRKPETYWFWHKTLPCLFLLLSCYHCEHKYPKHARTYTQYHKYVHLLDKLTYLYMLYSSSCACHLTAVEFDSKRKCCTNRIITSSSTASLSNWTRLWAAAKYNTQVKTIVVTHIKRKVHAAVEAVSKSSS